MQVKGVTSAKVLIRYHAENSAIKSVQQIRRRRQGLRQTPFGTIIGKVELVTTMLMVNFPEDARSGKIDGIFFNSSGAKLTEQEIAFGDYSNGRYGWLLDKQEQFESTIPLQGQVTLFDFMMCRICGCHQNDACIHSKHGNCSWHDIDLCSHCANYPGEATRSSKLKKQNFYHAS